jgi:hypothetical protein
MAVDFRRQQQISRLGYLDQAATMRGDADAAMGPGRMWNGSNVSGPFGENLYNQRLNETGERAQLRGALAGKPVTVHGGGTYEDEPMPTAPRRSLAALSGGESESDNLGFYGRQAAVQGQQIQNERQRDAEFDQATADDPFFAGERRAIRHADIVDQGAAQGEGAAAEYLAPGQNVARRQNLWDSEDRAKALGPYSPAAIKGETQLEQGREATRRASLVALENANARIGGQAIRSTGSIAASRANQGQDVTAEETRIGSLMPGGQPAGDKVVSPAELAQLTQAHPDKTPEQIRAQLLAKGYTFSGGADVR